MTHLLAFSVHKSCLLPVHVVSMCTSCSSFQTIAVGLPLSLSCHPISVLLSHYQGLLAFLYNFVWQSHNRWYFLLVGHQINLERKIDCTWEVCVYLFYSPSHISHCHICSYHHLCCVLPVLSRPKYTFISWLKFNSICRWNYWGSSLSGKSIKTRKDWNRMEHISSWSMLMMLVY